MPVWHELYEELRSDQFEIVSIAIDVQGPEVVKPYVKGITYPVLVDQASQLPSAFGYTVVPLFLLVDELGIIRVAKPGAGPGAKTIQMVRDFLKEEWATYRPAAATVNTLEDLANAHAKNPKDVSAAASYAHALARAGRAAEASTLFRDLVKRERASADVYAALATLELVAKRKQEALEVLNQGFAKYPKNWLIRKQKWAVENPEKFYQGAVDYRWQRQQQRAGK